jgi:hypothetical protein
MNKFAVITLDRRHNGWGHWTYRIEFCGYDSNYKSTRAADLHEARCWLWEHYGAGSEYRYARRMNIPWAWDTNNDRFILYLNQDVLTAFLLKFG